MGSVNVSPPQGVYVTFSGLKAGAFKTFDLDAYSQCLTLFGYPLLSHLSPLGYLVLVLQSCPLVLSFCLLGLSRRLRWCSTASVKNSILQHYSPGYSVTAKSLESESTLCVKDISPFQLYTIFCLFCKSALELRGFRPRSFR